MLTRIQQPLAYSALLVALAAPLVAQQPAGVITGVVVDSLTGAAVPDTVVFLAVASAQPLGPQTRQVTDERGRFAFVNLPGDVSYTIAATRLGYLDGGYGRDAAPTDPLRPIPLKNSEWIANIKVSIAKPGSISGIVRDESGEPVIGVVVRALQRIRMQGREDVLGGPLTRTDDHGAYRLAGLAPGRYLLQVPSVQAAVPASAKLGPDDSLPALRRMAEVLDVMDVDDSQRLVVGRYPIPPPPVNGRQLSYPSIFYPSTSVVAEATTIALKYGEERANVDLTLMPVASVRVSGTVDGPPQARESLTLRLLPVGLENAGFGAEVATALVAADGRFTFINVPAGDYVIDAPVYIHELSTAPGGIGPRRLLPGPPTTPVAGATVTGPIDLIPGLRLTTYNYRFSNWPFSGRASVRVGNADVTGLVVPLRPNGTMTGRVVVEKDPAQPDMYPPERFTFLLDPAGGEAPLGGSARGGGRGGVNAPQINFNAIVPGHYVLRLQGTPEWMVKSIVWSGHDYTDQPFDVQAGDTIADVVATVTNAVPELTGLVRDTDALKADATMVIVFPATPALWNNTGWWPARVKSAVLTSGSSFRFTLPAGDYLLAAISRSFTDRWREPEFLARVAPSASRVTIAWGRKSNADLQPVVVR